MSTYPEYYPLFFETSPANGSVLLLAGFLTLVSVAIVALALARRDKRNILQAIFFLVVDVVIYQAVFDVCFAETRGEPIRSVTGRLFGVLTPTQEVFAIIILLILGAFRFYRMLRLMFTSVTIFSIGEALDNLPMGVLFAGLQGEVLQSNKTMEDLNYEQTGISLFDARTFWQKIQRGEKMESEDTYLIKTHDGQSWLFRRDRLFSALGGFYQIVASNATKERQLTDTYHREVHRLKKMNRRLNAYNHIVDETIRKEELLEAKKRVHDNIGTSLLTARMLIQNEESPAKTEDVLRQWQEDLVLLREEAKDTGQTDPFLRFKDVANFLGIELQVMGEMPEQAHVADLISVGIQECMTNAIQHAEADQMYVILAETDEEYTAHYSNNGKPFQLPVHEGGGLSLLRRHAEKIGATMEYIAGKHFQLMLHIPKGG